MFRHLHEQCPDDPLHVIAMDSPGLIALDCAPAPLQLEVLAAAWRVRTIYQAINIQVGIDLSCIKARVICWEQIGRFR